jgi:hypothetical protein
LGKGADVPVTAITEIQTDNLIRLLQIGLTVSRRSRGDDNLHFFVAVRAEGITDLFLFGHALSTLPALVATTVSPLFRSLLPFPDLLDDPSVILLHLARWNLEEGTERPGAGFAKLQTDAAGGIVSGGKGSFR